MKNLITKKLNKKGFTLVELIVVILVLAILIGVSVSTYVKYIGKAKENTDLYNANTMQTALANSHTLADAFWAESESGSKAITVNMYWKKGAAKLDIQPENGAFADSNLSDIVDTVIYETFGNKITPPQSDREFVFRVISKENEYGIHVFFNAVNGEEG